MNDDKPSDAKRATPPAGGKAAPQGWKLLQPPSELVRALRDRAAIPAGDAQQVQPTGAVLAGDLAEMQPSDLLNFLHQGRRTGVLLARTEGVERGLVLVDGNVAWACSTSSGERLGELLCRMGLADRAAVETALERQGLREHPRRLGQLLVDQEVLDDDDVTRGLRHQVVEIFLGLLVSRSGTFVFLRGVERAGLPVFLALDTQALLLDGLRRLDEMELYRTRISSSEARPSLTGRPLPAADGQQVSAEMAAVFALADGQRTVAELATKSSLGEFEATKAIYKLVGAGYLAV